ncbi:MAG: hypothetical protein JKY49_13170 [Cohaesibacteraceae bacterium]|nr:hypothetical protein [Cohaesibacteraceae bacterium]
MAKRPSKPTGNKPKKTAPKSAAKTQNEPDGIIIEAKATVIPKGNNDISDSIIVDKVETNNKAPELKQEIQPQKSGITGHIMLAGLIGGTLTLAGFYALQSKGIIPVPPNTQFEQNIADQQQLVTTQGTISRLANLNTASLKKIEQRISVLENSRTELQASLDKLTQQVAETAIVENSTIPAITPDLSLFENKLEGFGQAIKSLESQFGNSGDLSKALRDELAAAGELASQNMEKLKSRLSSLSDTVQTSGNEALKQADRRINTIVEDLSTVRKTVSGSLGELGQRINALEIAIKSDALLQSAKTIAKSALDADIRAGRSYETSLQTFASVAGHNQILNVLARHAKTGVLTPAQFLNKFEILSQDIENTLNTGQANNALDGFWNSAKSLVSIRQTGAIEGENPKARMSRIRELIRNNLFSDAVIELDALASQLDEAEIVVDITKFRSRLSNKIVVHNALNALLQATNSTN